MMPTTAVAAETVDNRSAAPSMPSAEQLGTKKSREQAKQARQSAAPEWVEYLLPRGRPAVLHYLRSIWAGSVFAVYHTESMLVFAMLCAGLAAAVLGTMSVAFWLSAGCAAVLLVCLVVGGIRQEKTTCESGVYTYQRVLSGRGYRRGNRHIGPYETVIDLHTGLTPLKSRFFERLAEERPYCKSIGEAAQRTYQGLLHDDLSLVADAMIGQSGVLRADDIVRCRLYMHRRYVPWVEDYEVTQYELSEGGAFNNHCLARSLADFLQLSAAGLRLSQVRRNLMFKPHKLFKVFPTRTYLILPEERKAFVRKCIAKGALGQEYLSKLG